MTTDARRGHELDADDRNSLPDNEFAFPGKRKEPLSDASHVRNAIARFDQVEDVTDDERREAFARIKKAAKKYGVEMSESSWRDLGGSSGPSRDDLYEEAKRKNVKGRSSMTKEQLQRAVRG
jgi:Family of unknown function (DUF6582)